MIEAIQKESAMTESKCGGWASISDYFGYLAFIALAIAAFAGTTWIFERNARSALADVLETDEGRGRLAVLDAAFAERWPAERLAAVRTSALDLASLTNEGRACEDRFVPGVPFRSTAVRFYLVHGDARTGKFLDCAVVGRALEALAAGAGSGEWARTGSAERGRSP